MKNKRLVFIIFNLTFLLGYIFRMLTFGWLMVVLMLPEYIFRSIYYVLGIYILRHEKTENNYHKSTILQIFYLLTSFFSYDGGDINSYTFAHLWINPPDIIMFFWMLFAAITIFLLVFFTVKVSRFKRQVKEKLSCSSMIIYSVYALIVAPILALIIAMSFAKVFNF